MDSSCTLSECLIPSNTPEGLQLLSPSPHAQAVFLGLDIGSTTIKAVALDKHFNTVFSRYLRHNSHVRSTLAGLISGLSPHCHSERLSACITGSVGMELAHELNIPFLQEVLACTIATERYIPDADVLIELGGEDAKLIFLSGGIEQRMNETCAGGTGAFIDQMAAFIGTTPAELDQLALQSQTIYPIASRCGVFAKSDILPLLNEGCRKEDIAASIMQAVVNQTISGLALGRPIRGKVIFLGGPLHFLISLQRRFVASLKGMTEAVFPENGHFFVAIGAALHASEISPTTFSPSQFIHRLQNRAQRSPQTCLPPLFTSAKDLQTFRKRHQAQTLAQIPLEQATGPAWLGFDCGSTTIKAALVNSAGALLYSWYGPNRGNHLEVARTILTEIYTHKHPDLEIAGGYATGYGSALLAAALHLDGDEVETVAHAAAAAYFEPQVSFILDIGGQDIKCLHIKDGIIDRISLNEACSAGCGSFIENFSQSLGLSLPEFVNSALLAPAPVDLGIRCTVFMNSKVRQAQKDGANLNDIAAGLCWSVVRNAIYKVMKIANAESLGDHIVAQGGAFLNDALLRALELELGRKVTRPILAGLMGAFGAALIAQKRLPAPHKSHVLDQTALSTFSVVSRTTRCKHCSNSCLLTISTFGNKEQFISGNRCERGTNASHQKLPNLPAWKYKLLFNREPLPPEAAPRGRIGIPRALNIFENYPLWFAIFTSLGYRVELSDASCRESYYDAYDTIASQTVCYPAKLAHGHVLNLVRKGLKIIFFPCIQREQSNADFRHGTFNCPVVAGYPELIVLNMRALADNNVIFIHDFLPLEPASLAKRLLSLPPFADIPAKYMEKAVAKGFAALTAFRQEVQAKGEEILQELAETGRLGIILAGHPYHIDPDINHGMAELINACGVGVLTEDAVAHLRPDPGPLRIVDQWAYHSRLFRAGAFAGSLNNVAVAQLVSFGCGIDALTSDQLEETLIHNGRLYAQIKIDEGMNLGGARIRIRSLLAAMREKLAESKQCPCRPDVGCVTQKQQYPLFLPEMKHTHTLLVPQMSPLHFQFAPQIFASEGYSAELLSHVSRNAIGLGLRHVNNDACYPAIIIIGQLLEALKSGKYDPDKIALVLSQTGGGCRATNYVALLYKALVSAGLGHVPIANFSTGIAGPGIRLTPRLISRMVMAGHYGDALMRMLHRLRPYEQENGAAENLVEEWSRKAAINIANGSIWRFQRNMFAMVKDFDNLPLRTEPRRPVIGIVGEILLKYHPQANNHATHIIEKEGGEAMVTDIMDFMLYCLYDHVYNYENLVGSRKNWLLAQTAIGWQQLTRLSLNMALSHSKHFTRPARFKDLRRSARKIISLGHQCGEGWLLAAEMIRMLESGVAGILCIQPFGCLPNHVVGKGLIRELKNRFPNAAIMSLDYDASASEANQINRIKLLMRSGLNKNLHY